MARPRTDAPDRDDPGRGRRLGVDVEDVRIGIAVSGLDCTLAIPVEAVTRTTRRKDPDRPDIDRLVELATELEVVEIVVDMPLILDGSFGTSARKATDVGFRLQRRLGGRVVVRYIDKRVTMMMAQSRLHATGIDVKSGRKVIDQVVTVEILWSWLDRRAKVSDGVTD